MLKYLWTVKYLFNIEDEGRHEATFITIFLFI